MNRLLFLLLFLTSSVAGQEVAIQGNGQVPKALADLGVKQSIYDMYPTRPHCPMPVTIHKGPHDADTLTDVTIHLPLKIDLVHESIRANGYDAWEVSKVRQSKAAGQITDAEIAKGLKAKDALNALLLKPGKVFYADNRLYVDIVGRDVYGRVLANLYIQLNDGPTLEWMNLAVWARSNGHQRTPELLTSPK